MATPPPDKALTHAVLELVLQIPDSTETVQVHPSVRAQAIARSAARSASVISGSLSLPPGLLGWLTVVPELIGVWKLQAQMVSDIAAVYGKKTTLGREQMVYCLFKHISAQLFRDLVVRVGERVVVRQTSLTVLQNLAKTVGVQVTKTVISKSAARFVPLLGAVTVGAYAYFDTLQVAKTAVELFERDIIIEVEPTVVAVNDALPDVTSATESKTRSPEKVNKRKGNRPS